MPRHAHATADPAPDRIGLRSPQSLDALLAVASSQHGPEGHLHLPSIGVPPGPSHDHLADPENALEWLGPRHELAVPGSAPSRSDLAALRAIRRAVQLLVRGDRRGHQVIVERLAKRARYRVTPDGRLEPDAEGWAAIATGLVIPLLVLDAMRSRLRRCRNPRCGWLFLDGSDNRTRRWCDANACGDRIRVRRHRARRSMTPRET